MDETTSERRARGRHMMHRVNAEAGQEMIDQFHELSPDFENILLDFVFADIYDRDVLTLRERQLVRLGALAALDPGEAPLRANIDAALNLDLTSAEIVEAFLQCLPYAGFPRVIDALHTARIILDSPPNES